ncbi:E3 ubiquitin-protein ligase complex slx8-rfp subunit slx8 [Colletotrichum chlorophyti]|uniref:E3 ubiquitin-protein ligase complex slx8-rfp subunit slx8 n=1 Tax=Colletotrichum chlorophyti TaxID=708187 RepID=A0A1Q8RBT9_9PEZI|nr:E3 ubiquitin-protein ligase complex slx8-rfp subunit slx8 [Colletotrichum chlorophyti]
MPGLVPFLPTLPLPQPRRSASIAASSRPANNLLNRNRGVARGSSSQAPIELDDDEDEPTLTATNPPPATPSQDYQQAPDLNFDQSWSILTPDNTQNRQSLPSFSNFAANLDYYYSVNPTAPVQNAPPQTPSREPNSDDFLSALIDGNFSTPSSYPQSTQASLASHRNALDRHPSGTPLQQPRSAGSFLQNPPTQQTPHPDFLVSEIEESLFVSSEDESEGIMPVQTRRRASTALSSDQEPDDAVAPASRKRTAASSRASAAPKRRRTSQGTATRPQSTTSSQRRTVPDSEDDIFGDKDGSDKGKEKDEDVIDLAAANEVPEEMLVPKEEKRVKLSAFQCVICMDDVTALTVTHCGHLFCSECLHSALNVDATRNKCPICRQKVETKDRSDYTTKTKGFWPLELKLMTTTRKGKGRA